ncbi:substrate import-associated zinc metallohydrolase lipoprotein [Chitinophaga niastensis]|uniref:Substrate import-associated zinc metallohydrolase lipoprotein n=1 Tax=Chitinophaga niastensis TaxID=536980 RepID=A0A2P8HMU5_CHINA|nr:putative zinc-binding metallopeptidase [Chitinophaga niastensis]PSL47530.1 substrate import-associated zinc metallohydrolase lipoprotein [Chitinophaga niastensis]
MKALLLITTLCLLMACSKKDDLGNVEEIPGLGGDTWVKGPLDQWLYDTLTVPYNIAVKYKWDQFEYELNKTLVPPKEEKVIPVMSAIKKVWMNTYVAEAGTLFFKKYCPKYFILSGSASWNENGTITLGTAEGGRKVVLYLLNDFLTKDMPGYQPADSGVVKQMFHVIEHEFGHILHQTTMYPVEFKRICAGFYTGNWNNISDENAHRDGFVTPYAMSAFDEDFVEMISTMLVEGRTGFDMIVNSIPEGTSINGVSKAEAQARLRRKEAIVVSYFQTVWHIDFYSLQNRTRKEIVQLLY